MKLSSVSALSFKAKYVCNPVFGRPNKQVFDNEFARQKIISHYDSQISKIEKQKQKALDLEDFMQSDEIKAILEELPPEDQVISNTINGYSPIEKKPVNKMELYYFSNSAENTAKITNYDYQNYSFDDHDSHFYKSAEKSGGELDKDGIVTWLKEITDILKRNK